MNKHALFSSKLAMIAGILYLIAGAFIITIGMITPVEININGNYTEAYLWEFAEHPGALSFYLFFALIPIVFGILGLLISKRVKHSATKAQGIFMIIAGVMSIVFVVGVLFIIAGIQALLAKKEQELTDQSERQTI